MFVRDKNKPKFYISSPWGTYFISIVHFSAIYKFLVILKKSSLGSKLKCVSLRFYQKMSVPNENWSEIHISSSWGPYSCSVRFYGGVHYFLRFSKISSFGSKSILPKNVCSRWKSQKSIFHPREARILSWLDISILYINF
jgi:hypothetical protein